MIKPRDFGPTRPWTRELAAAALYRHTKRHGTLTSPCLQSYWGLPDQRILKRLGVDGIAQARELAHEYPQMLQDEP